MLNDYDLFCKLHNEYVEICETMQNESMTYVLSPDEIAPEKRERAKELGARISSIMRMERHLEKRNGWLTSFVCNDDGCTYWVTNANHPYGSGHIVNL